MLGTDGVHRSLLPEDIGFGIVVALNLAGRAEEAGGGIVKLGGLDIRDDGGSNVAAGDQQLAVGKERRSMIKTGRDQVACRDEGAAGRVVKLRGADRTAIAVDATRDQDFAVEE
jgi:hypothetical protein